MEHNPFSKPELEARLERFRDALARRRLDAAILAAPENVFYLTGLDHWGYFAPHLLIVPLDGRPVLITRAMERVTIEKQVFIAEFRGHADGEPASDLAARVLSERRLGNKRIGLEFRTGGVSHGLVLRLQSKAEAIWTDISGVVDQLRLVKSETEQALMRAAAAVTDAGAAAAIAAIGEGAGEAEVAAECVAAMIRAGGHPPGFGPFIRPAARLSEEHTSWGSGTYQAGEPVFLELSGCISRYHAPLGRLIRLGAISDEDATMAALATDAFTAVREALRPGAKAREVYAAWQDVVDAAGLSDYRRHHCGYCIGIGQPPSWTGGNTVMGLRRDSDLVIETGMSFHILSWLMATGRGDHFLSDTVLLTDNGTEILTRAPRGPIIR